jgi:CubicO group peptidase (beta-lactamase class C family)
MNKYLIITSILLLFNNLLLAQENETLKVTEKKAKEIEDIMDRIYENDQVFGTILVAVEGEIIFEKAYGFANLEWNIPNTIDTKYRIASVTKPFTTILILQLIEQGKIKLDGKLTDYLPDFPAEKGKNITIHQLLTHTSGIISEWKLSDLEDKERLYYSRERLFNEIAKQDIAFKPGERRGYSNFGYALLAMVAERVSGKSYNDLLQEKICIPAGMKNTIPDIAVPLINTRASGYQFDYFTGYENAALIDMSFVVGYGHLLSAVEDLHLFDQALYTDKLLSEKSKELFFDRKGQFGWEYVKFKYGKNDKEIECNQYNGSINGFGSHIQRIAKDKVFICILRNMKERGNKIVIKYPNFMASRIVSILYDEEYEQPKKSAAYEVFKTLINSGVEKMEKKHSTIKENQTDKFYFNEKEFNSLKKKLIAKNMSNEAEAYFKPYQKKFIQLNSDKLKIFVGKYSINKNIINISVKDNNLFVDKSWDDNSYKIFPISEQVFFEKEDLIKFEFNKTSSGQIKSFTINGEYTFDKDE